MTPVKLVPRIVTLVPVGPVAGEKLVIAGLIVKFDVLVTFP